MYLTRRPTNLFACMAPDDAGRFQHPHCTSSARCGGASHGIHIAVELDHHFIFTAANGTARQPREPPFAERQHGAVKQSTAS